MGANIIWFFRKASDMWYDICKSYYKQFYYEKSIWNFNTVNSIIFWCKSTANRAPSQANAELLQARRTTPRSPFQLTSAP